MTRRADAVGSKFVAADPEPVLHILVVTARPDGPSDVGYRTISRPLLDSLRNARLPVEVDLVRPGTWEALRAHLRSVTEEHGSGWYQVAHFDLHGSFSDYRELEAGSHAEQLLFASGPDPFQGRRGFLYFETGQTGKAKPVAAEEVATLLAEHRIPIAVLNACQSAKQAGRQRGRTGAATSRGRRPGHRGHGVLGDSNGRRKSNARPLRKDRWRSRSGHGRARGPPRTIRPQGPTGLSSDKS